MILNANGTVIKPVASVKLFWLEIDRDLSFNSHVDKLCNKLSQRIGVLK